MATNKERIETLEAVLAGIFTEMQGIVETMHRLSDAILSNARTSTNNNSGSQTQHETAGN